MPEAAVATAPRTPITAIDGDTMLVARDVHVTYRINEDRRPTLRRWVLHRVRKQGFRSIDAVRGVSLTMRKGDAVAIVGRNGSGKSTLLRALAGLLPPTHGDVHARAKPVLLGVRAAFDRKLSARSNAYIGGAALGLSRREVTERLDEIFGFAGLQDYIDVPLQAYSSGMAARLQFSVATIVQPEVLFVDEALAVGDAEFRKRSRERISSIIDAAGTVAIVAHNLRSLQASCNRAIWLDAGRIVADGPLDQVLDAYAEATGDEEHSARRRA